MNHIIHNGFPFSRLWMVNRYQNIQRFLKPVSTNKVTGERELFLNEVFFSTLLEMIDA